jgi:hypothetical protein
MSDQRVKRPDSAKGIHSLDEVLNRVGDAGDEETVCVGHLVSAMGQRSFGPLLLVPSLLVTSPLSGLPGFSSLAGITNALIAAQMLVGRETVWLPQTIRARCIGRSRLDKAIDFLGPVARLMDWLVRPRLSVLTRRPFNRLVAAICVLAGLVMPVLGLVPFASSIIGAAVATFALALVAGDGVLVAIATVGILAIAGLGISALL